MVEAGAQPAQTYIWDEKQTVYSTMQWSNWNKRKLSWHTWAVKKISFAGCCWGWGGNFAGRRPCSRLPRRSNYNLTRTCLVKSGKGKLRDDGRSAASLRARLTMHRNRCDKWPNSPFHCLVEQLAARALGGSLRASTWS